MRKYQKRAATCDAYRVANQQRMAARRVLEWITTLKAQLDLKMKYQTCLIWQILNLAIQSLNQKVIRNHYDISVTVSCSQKTERTFPLLPSPLVCTCCPLRCDCLGACRVAICFSQSAHHILLLVIFFSVPEGEKNPDIAFSGEYMQVSFLKYWYSA